MPRPKKSDKKREKDVSIGERLKVVRKRILNATQAEFAERYDVSEQTVRMWEKGVYSVPDVVLYDISDITGIDIDFLKCKYDHPFFHDLLKKWNESITDDWMKEYRSQSLLFEYCDSIGHSFLKILDELELTATDSNCEHDEYIAEKDKIVNDFVHSINTFIIAKEAEIKKGVPTMSESVKAYLMTVSAWEIKLPIFQVYEDYKGFCNDQGYVAETIGNFAKAIQ